MGWLSKRQLLIVGLALGMIGCDAPQAEIAPRSQERMLQDLYLWCMEHPNHRRVVPRIIAVADARSDGIELVRAGDVPLAAWARYCARELYDGRPGGPSEEEARIWRRAIQRIDEQLEDGSSDEIVEGEYELRQLEEDEYELRRVESEETPE